METLTRPAPSKPTAVALRLGLQLRAARLAAGLTQEEAADLAGVSGARWGQMERGSTSNINKLQAACVSIGALLIVCVKIPDEDE